MALITWYYGGCRASKYAGFCAEYRGPGEDISVNSDPPKEEQCRNALNATWRPSRGATCARNINWMAAIFSTSRRTLTPKVLAETTFSRPATGQPRYPWRRGFRAVRRWRRFRSDPP